MKSNLFFYLILLFLNKFEHMNTRTHEHTYNKHIPIKIFICNICEGLVQHKYYL